MRGHHQVLLLQDTRVVEPLLRLGGLSGQVVGREQAAVAQAGTGLRAAGEVEWCVAHDRGIQPGAALIDVQQGRVVVEAEAVGLQRRPVALDDGEARDRSAD